MYRASSIHEFHFQIEQYMHYEYEYEYDAVVRKVVFLICYQYVLAVQHFCHKYQVC